MTRHALLALLLAVALGPGCTRHDPLAGTTEAERAWIDRLGRDPAVRIWRTERRDDDTLEVWTRQGDIEVRYLLIPDPNGVDGLRLVRLERGIVLGDDGGP